MMLPQVPACGRCGTKMSFPPEYCAHCQRNRCPACASEGCCGHAPMQGSRYDVRPDHPGVPPDCTPEEARWWAKFGDMDNPPPG